MMMILLAHIITKLHRLFFKGRIVKIRRFFLELWRWWWQWIIYYSYAHKFNGDNNLSPKRHSQHQWQLHTDIHLFLNLRLGDSFSALQKWHRHHHCCYQVKKSNSRPRVSFSLTKFSSMYCCHEITYNRHLGNGTMMMWQAH